MPVIKSFSGVLIGLYATVLGCGTDATQLPSDASRPVEQTPDAHLILDAQPIDGSLVLAMPDASPPECLDTPLMIFGGSIEGEEFDHEAVEFADGRVFVLRRLLDGSSAPAVERTQLWRVDTDGSNAEFLAEIDGRPRAIESNATHVYFTSGTSGLWRFPLGSPANTKAEHVVDSEVSAIYLSDKLYYATNGGIYRSDLDGANPEQITESTNSIRQIALDGDNLYFAKGFGLYRQTVGQNSALRIGTTGTYDSPYAFFIYQNLAYTISFYGRLASSGLDGSNVESYGPNDANSRGQDILIIGEWIYWSNNSHIPIRRMNLSTHEFENLDAFTSGSQGLATDGTNIFSVSSGALWSIPSCVEGTQLP